MACLGLMAVSRQSMQGGCSPTINLVVGVRKPTLPAWALRERPEPREWIRSAHSLADVGPDAHIPWELLVVYAYFDTVWALEITAEDTRSAQKSVVPFDLPALDGPGVDGQ